MAGNEMAVVTINSDNFRILELGIDLGDSQTDMHVKIRRIHADKVCSGDELIKVGDYNVENLTLAKLREAMASPLKDYDGFGTRLTFKNASGVVYRFIGEVIKFHASDSAQGAHGSPEVHSTVVYEQQQVVTGSA
mmetsp:Transcript_42978/g.114959  ORF Transcript_42978/g.114959 Transcript_42978/m.114959 type:complete len:135 (+) Transcript_42978:100-504(+)